MSTTRLAPGDRASQMPPMSTSLATSPTSSRNSSSLLPIRQTTVDKSKKKRKEYFKLRRFDGHARALDPAKKVKVVQWRMNDRMKTVAVGLVCCLNIGVDPPDVIKSGSCARMECWIDPGTDTPQKALDLIGKQLQSQYERWQPRARYKILPDPTVEDVKKLCLSLRRVAKRERILFHYNGHGVPKPTNNGEIWMFNKSYTQYIPLSLYELQSWMGTPSIYVLDCSAAGMIMHWFQQFAEQREREQSASDSAGSRKSVSSSSLSSAASNSSSSSSTASNSSSSSASTSPNSASARSRAMKGCILLAPCGANETLPTHSHFPADLFTACLTTPVKTALRWFCSTNPMLKGVNLDIVDRIPGKLNDRRTPLGEINWIFTAITDTIAWNVLPPPLFQKLYRQDLLVASLFRNYLLAERIFKSVGCTPCSYPKLPPTFQHSMWDSWDLTVESFLFHLLSNPVPNDGLGSTRSPADDSTAAGIAVTGSHAASSSSTASSSSATTSGATTTTTAAASAAAPWPNSFFYSDQLTAFEVWLEFATEHHKPPEQLPIVLQVLLSQAHRHRALYLLARFLDLGPWATNLALSVGIFPYVLKLLQSPAQDLRLILVFIWAKILALDHSCQTDLVKDQEPPYFLAVFNSKSSSDLRTMAAFVLSVIMDNHPRGQAVCLKSGLLSDCLAHLSDPDPLLRRWVILCLGKLWEDNEEARWAAVRESAHERLCGLLTDSVPEVRAAVVFALGTFIQTDHTKLRPNAQTSDSESDDGSLSSSPAASATGRRHRQNSGNSGMELRINIEMNLGVTLPVVMEDASPMVRKELICALSRLVDSYSERFKEVASEEEHRRTSSQSSVLGVGGDESPNLAALSSSPSAGTYRPQQSSVYACLWKVVLSLRADPVPDVAVLADRVVRRIYKSIGGIASLSRLNSTSPALSIGSKGFDGVSPLHLDPEADHAANTHQDSPPVERPSRLTSLLSVGSRSSVRDSKTRRKIPTPSEHHQPDVANLDDLLKDDEEGPIALSSQFYEWSCEYFSQPLHVFPSGRLVPSTTAIEDPVLSESSSFLVTEPPTADLSRPNAFEELHVSSGEYAHLVLRQRRNNRVITEAFNIGQNTKNAPPKIDYPIAILDNATSVSRRLAFHPFEPLLISVNDQNNVGVWNWEEGQSFNSFANQNAPGTRITSLCLMNQQYDALLATGSNEGTIRIWKDFANQESPVKLLTAFRALPDFFPTTRGSGLIFDWNHERGVLAVSGDLHVIRLWDMDRELCTSDIQTLCDSPVTCLSSDRLSSHSLLAGFGNGKFRTFDTRAPTRHSTGIIFPDFETWVVNAQTLSSDHQVVAASASGMIKIFDLRQTGCALMQSIDRRGEKLTALVAHQYAPVIATGSASQRITLLNFKGEEISQVKYHEGFLGQRIGPVSCLAFHPYLLYLAAGATDHIISVYTQTP